MRLGYKFGNNICAKAESGWLLKSTAQKQNSKQPLSKISLEKVTVQNFKTSVAT